MYISIFLCTPDYEQVLRLPDLAICTDGGIVKGTMPKKVKLHPLVQLLRQVVLPPVGIDSHLGMPHMVGMNHVKESLQ